MDEQRERRTVHAAIAREFRSLARAIWLSKARRAERKALIASELKGLEAKWGAGRRRIVLERHEEAEPVGLKGATGSFGMRGWVHARPMQEQFQ